MGNLYHYCSVDSFQKIISEKSIRLSSLLLSNDYNEGKTVISLIDFFMLRKAEAFSDRDKILNLLSIFPDHFHGIGFCLSEEGDLLSQWRGYASNGEGFSIGFSRDGLESVCHSSKTLGIRDVSLRKVDYDGIDHFNVVEPIIRELEIICNDAKYKSTLAGLLALLPADDFAKIQESKNKEKNHEFLKALIPISNHLYTLKSIAFSEEKEWRLLSTIEGDDFHKVNCHAKSNKLVPYDTIHLEDKLGSIVREVIIGPRNETPQKVLEHWLKEQGIGNIAISKSKASYR